LCRHILARYKKESLSLYKPCDLESGAINGIDCEGRPLRFPFITLSIGVVSDRFHCPGAVDEIGALTAEAKRRAKRSSNKISRISLDDWCYPIREHVPVSPTARPSNPLDRLQRKVVHNW